MFIDYRRTMERLKSPSLHPLSLPLLQGRHPLNDLILSVGETMEANDQKLDHPEPTLPPSLQLDDELKEEPTPLSGIRVPMFVPFHSAPVTYSLSPHGFNPILHILTINTNLVNGDLIHSQQLQEDTNTLIVVLLTASFITFVVFTRLSSGQQPTHETVVDADGECWRRVLRTASNRRAVAANTHSFNSAFHEDFRIGSHPLPPPRPPISLFPLPSATNLLFSILPLNDEMLMSGESSGMKEMGERRRADLYGKKESTELRLDNCSLCTPRPRP